MLSIKIDDRTELGQILERTSMEKPKWADKQALHDYLEKHGGAELARIGDLSNQVSSGLIELIGRTHYSFQVALCEQVAKLEHDLGNKSASPLEQMLIRHICIAWLRYHECELRYESVRNNDYTYRQMEHWEKRLSAAQRRYLRSVETLARVRRLLKDPPTLAILMKQQLTVGR